MMEIYALITAAGRGRRIKSIFNYSGIFNISN